jgi:hypothetical protein
MLTKKEVIKLVQAEFEYAEAWRGSFPPDEAEAERTLSKALARMVIKMLSSMSEKDIESAAQAVRLESKANYSCEA